MQPAPKELVTRALEAAKHAHAPYSRFRVGAALVAASGRVYVGANIENASYPCGICAERAAVARAVVEGETRFTAIAVAALRPDGAIAAGCTPCGLCRQTLREFAAPGDFKVYVADSASSWRTFTLAELLPESFGPEKLKPPQA